MSYLLLWISLDEVKGNRAWVHVGADQTTANVFDHVFEVSDAKGFSWRPLRGFVDWPDTSGVYFFHVETAQLTRAPRPALDWAEVLSAVRATS
jgi:hypothetical protein